MTSKWIDGRLWHKEDFRYTATVIRRTVPRFKFRPLPGDVPNPQLEFEFYDSRPTVRRFEKRKDAEKWLKYEKSYGALTKLDVRAAWYRSVW